MNSSSFFARIRSALFRENKPSKKKRQHQLRLMHLEDRRVLNGAVGLAGELTGLAVPGVELTSGETLTISDGGMSDLGNGDVHTLNLTLTDLTSTWSTGSIDANFFTNAGGNVLKIDHALIESGGADAVLLSGADGDILAIQGSGAESDQLILDLQGLDFIPNDIDADGDGGIAFSGGEDLIDPVNEDTDTLTITGYTLDTADGVADVTVNHTGTESGSVMLAGLGTVTFSEIEPLMLDGTAADLVINLPAGDDGSVVLSDDGTANDGVSQINSPAFELTSFVNPTNSLTINDPLLGAKTIAVNGLDAGFDADLSILDADATDNNIVSFGAATNTNGGDLTVEGLTISSTMGGTITTTGDVADDDSGNLMITAGTNVNLLGAIDTSGFDNVGSADISDAGNVTIMTANGNIAVAGIDAVGGDNNDADASPNGQGGLITLTANDAAPLADDVGDITIGGNISTSALAVNTVRLQINAAEDLTINAALDGGGGDLSLIAEAGALTQSSGTISGPSIVLSAATGIGSAAAIQTVATNLQFNNTTNGTNITNTGALTINGASSFGSGGGKLSAGSPLTINAAVTSGADFILEAAGDGGVNSVLDDLTINAAVTHTGIAGVAKSITLRADDDVIFQSGLVSFTNTNAGDTLTVQADSAAVPTPDANLNGDIQFTGGTINVGLGTANFSTNTAAGGGAILGNAAAGTDVTAGTASFSAATGIGSTNAIETNITQLTLDNTTSGNVQISENDGVTFLTNVRNQAAAGTLSVVAGGTINTAAATTSTNNGTLTLDANGAAADVIVGTGGVASAGGLIDIDADRDVQIDGGVTSEGGNVAIDAGRNITSGAAGDITTTGNVANEDSGTVTMDAGRDIDLAGSIDTSGIDNAMPGDGANVTLTTVDGNIRTQSGATLDAQGGDSAADMIPDAEGGMITLDANAITAPFTFNPATAINVANEQITWAAHGLQTGDLVVYDNGDSAAPIPADAAPLVTGQTYAIIVVDANTVRLAATQANALAGTAINLTSVGAATGHVLTTAGVVTTNDTVNTSTENGAATTNIDIDADNDVYINAAVNSRGGTVDIDATAGDINSGAAGDITTSADKADEDSGNVTMDAATNVTLLGDITTDGFDNIAAPDSDAGDVTINAADGNITTAAISAIGGDTLPASGMGEGGTITLNADDGNASGTDGDVTTNGAINTSTEMAATTNVNIDADRDVNINQTINTRGGNVDLDAGRDINSAAAGDITTTGDKPAEASGNVTMDAGRDITLDGFIDSSGIDNAAPGAGGNISLTTVDGNITTVAAATLDATGGDAAADMIPDAEGGIINLDANSVAAALTFDPTADVNLGTDQITWAAHGLQTGDRVGYDRGDQKVVADITPLTTSTDYFVIVIDANTIQLATTEVNATAGTQINLTAVGAGTMHILFPAADITVGDAITTSTEAGATNVVLNGQRDVTINAPVTSRGGNVDVDAGRAISGNANGDITTSADKADEDSGNVTMDAATNVTLLGDITTDGFDNIAAPDSDAGDVTINAADGNITTAAISAIGGDTLPASGMGEGGTITLNADDGNASGTDGDVTTNGAINTSTEMAATTNVNIDADRDVNINQTINTRGGNVDLDAGRDINSAAAGDITTTGDKPAEASGNVTMDAGRDITLDGFIDSSGIDNAAPGAGGNISLTTVDGNITTVAAATLDATGGTDNASLMAEGGTIAIDANTAAIAEITLNPAETVDIATNQIFWCDHVLMTGDIVTYDAGGGTAVGGLVSGNQYYVTRIDGDNIQLSVSPTAAAINLTNVGTGAAHTLNAAAGTATIGAAVSTSTEAAVPVRVNIDADVDVNLNAALTTLGASVTVDAGRDINTTAPGDITTSGDKPSENSGNVTMNAGRDAMLAGEINTSGFNNAGVAASSGGNITVNAADGNVSTANGAALNTVGGSTSDSAVMGEGGTITLDANEVVAVDVTFDPAVSTNLANNRILWANHGLETGDQINYSNGGGTDIGGLVNGQNYFVIQVDGGAIQLSATAGGGAIDLTSVGTGQIHTLDTFDGNVTVGEAITTSTEAANSLRVDIDGDANVAINNSITTNGGAVDIDAGANITTNAAGDITTTGDKPDEDSGVVTMDAWLDIDLAGAIDTSGLDNTAPGKGANITLTTVNGNIRTQSGATLDAQGGDSAATADGIPDDEGGIIQLDANAITAPFTFNPTTALNVTNDQITWTAHGLVTGDFVVYDNGDSVAPTAADASPLVTGQTYAIIVVDTNTVQLAATQANAIAGTAINLTSVGAAAGHVLTTAGVVTTNDTVNTSTENGAATTNIDIDADNDVYINAAVNSRGGTVDVDATAGDINSGAAGDITTSADKADEDSGNVTMDAATNVTLLGDITTDGFDNIAAPDSDAGDVTINAADGNITTAAISAIGGDTVPTTGMGEGGIVTLNADDADASGTDGDVTTNGAINTSTEIAATNVNIDADRDVNINQSITTRGGTVDIDAMGNITSMATGDITTSGSKADMDSGDVTINSTVAGEIDLTGTIDTSGFHNTTNALDSDGGDITIATTDGFVRITEIDSSGGNIAGTATDVAGNAGTISANSNGATPRVFLRGNLTSAGGVNTNAATVGETRGDGASIVFVDDVQIGDASSPNFDLVITTTGREAGDVTFQQRLDATTDGAIAATIADANDLTIIARDTDAENLANPASGNVTFDMAVGSVTRLGQLTIADANDVTANDSILATKLTQTTGVGNTTLSDVDILTRELTPIQNAVSITTDYNISLQGNITATDAAGQVDNTAATGETLFFTSIDGNVSVANNVILSTDEDTAALASADVTGDAIRITANAAGTARRTDGSTPDGVFQAGATVQVRTDGGVATLFAPRPAPGVANTAFYDFTPLSATGPLSGAAIAADPAITGTTVDQQNYLWEWAFNIGGPGEENLRVSIDWRDPELGVATIPVNTADNVVNSGASETFFVRDGDETFRIGHIYTQEDITQLTLDETGPIFPDSFAVAHHDSIQVFGNSVLQNGAATEVDGRTISSTDNPDTIGAEFENGSLEVRLPSVFLPPIIPESPPPEPAPAPLAVAPAPDVPLLFVNAVEPVEYVLTSFSTQSEDFFQLRNAGSNDPVPGFERIDDAIGWKLLQPRRLKQWVGDAELDSAEGYELWLITTKARNGEDVTFERPVLKFDIFQDKPFPMEEDLLDDMPELELERLDVDELGDIIDGDPPVENVEDEPISDATEKVDGPGLVIPQNESTTRMDSTSRTVSAAMATLAVSSLRKKQRPQVSEHSSLVSGLLNRLSGK